MCLSPVRCNRTSWAAQRTRNLSLRVDSSPTRSVSPLSKGSRPASVRSKATVSSATPVQLPHSVRARGLRNVNRARLTGRARPANTGAYSARASGFVARTSRRPFWTIAWHLGHALKHADDARTNLLPGQAAAGATHRTGCARQREQVFPLGLVQL